jgi:hypothetical protein
MKDSERSHQLQLLAKGFGILMGEAYFAVSGPFLFCRFGLNVPLAAATGCLVGAPVGYAFTALILWVRNRKPAVTPAPIVRHGPVPRAA